MSHNPYAADSFNPAMAEPPRTSFLAIGSLVCSLICCIPGLGAIGTALGAIALIRTSSSGGRKSGTGLAIAGIIIGVLVSAFQIFTLIGGHAIVRKYVQEVNPIIATMQTADFDQIKPQLPTAIGQRATKADWDRFRAEVQAELGTVAPMPDSMIEFFRSYMKVGQRMQQPSAGAPQQPPLPVPLIGDKGQGVLFIHMSPGGSGDDLMSGAENFEVRLPSGKTVFLIPPGTPPATTNPTPLPGSTPPASPPVPSDTPGTPVTPPSGG